MSPTIFREGQYRFYFFSREEMRMHVHVASADGEAKFWVEPQVALATSFRFSHRQLGEIERLVLTHLEEIRAAWRTHFGS